MVTVLGRLRRFGASAVFSLCLCAVSTSGGAQALPADESPYHIVVAQRAARAGERVELRVLPLPAAGVRVRWWVLSGEVAIALVPPIYRARPRHAPWHQLDFRRITCLQVRSTG